jgi:RNA polymerase sigma-70 factor (ECF subfamily)
MEPTPELIQNQLLARIAERDVHALAEFYDQTATPFFSVAVRILQDPTEAEEVIQDVFVQIWEKARAFDPQLGSAFYWALSITRHKAIDRLRSRQRRALLVDQLLELGDAPEPTVAPDEDAAGLETAATIRLVLVELPKDQRQAIELAFFGGLSHPEIAEALEQPLGTVKARIRRGLLKMRECLQMKS